MSRIPIKTDQIDQAYQTLKSGQPIIIPTRVGYIIGGNSDQALQAMYDLKARPLNKPGVCLINRGILEHLAEVQDRFIPFIDEIERRKLLLGFILQRKSHPLFDNQPPFVREHSQQTNGTSCFVINAGEYCQYIADKCIANGTLFIASSANASGTGNERKFEEIPENIRNGVGYALEHNDFVAQEHVDPNTREQGVMIDLHGKFPTITRRGFEYQQIEQIMYQFIE